MTPDPLTLAAAEQARSAAVGWCWWVPPGWD